MNRIRRVQKGKERSKSTEEEYVRTVTANWFVSFFISPIEVPCLYERRSQTVKSCIQFPVVPFSILFFRSAVDEFSLHKL